MKSHAFTLVELLMIIVIVGIISVSVSTRFTPDGLEPASTQLLNHIRYTQHLALNQDMYKPSRNFSIYDATSMEARKEVQYWYKRWWQIEFLNDSGGGWSYSIYSDHPSSGNNASYDRKPDRNDILARDPQTGKWIIGNYSESTTSSYFPESERLELVDLTEEYGVSIDVKTCRYNGSFSTSDRVIFDSMGRPHCHITRDNILVTPYERLMTEPLEIVLTSVSEGRSKTILIEPFTGYSYFK